MSGGHYLRLALLSLYFLDYLLTTETKGLYSDGDSVVSMSANDFYKHLLHKENAWMVEFYNTWCGHCVNFAPTYKKFARDVKGWSRVLSVGAIDCSQTENSEICRKYDIDAYPEIVLFAPNVSRSDKGYLTRGTRGMQTLFKDAIQFVSDRSKFKAPKSWPRLEPMKNIEDIWSEPSTKHKHVLLVFEKKDSITGREIILDTMNQPQILVRRLLKESVSKYGITQFPSLYSLSKDGAYQKLAVGKGGENDRALFINVIKEKFGINLNEGEEDGAGQGDVSKNTENEGADKDELSTHISNVSVVHMQDIESAVTYLFRQEVAIHKNINGDAFQALKNFVLILAKYLPVRKPISSFLWKVSDWLSEQHGGLTGEEWSHQIESLQSKESFLPDNIVWTGCHGSKMKFRGYPCSMWTMFHTLTVSSYLSSRKDQVERDPVEVLSAVRGYMTHFFGCTECAKNFNKMAVTIPQEVKKMPDSVLWLWSAHNKANKRLHGDQTEDPFYPKIQFPSKVMCSECHKPGSTNANPIWNTPEVFKYIIHMYRAEDIEEDVSKNASGQTQKPGGATEELDWWERQQRKQDLRKIQDIRSRKKNGFRERLEKREWIEFHHQFNVKEKVFISTKAISSWGFLSSVDLGMCMIFYFVCAVIILLMYYHFTVRKKWRPCGFFPV